MKKYNSRSPRARKTSEEEESSRRRSGRYESSQQENESTVEDSRSLSERLKDLPSSTLSPSWLLSSPITHKSEDHQEIPLDSFEQVRKETHFPTLNESLNLPESRSEHTPTSDSTAQKWSNLFQNSPTSKPPSYSPSSRTRDKRFHSPSPHTISYHQKRNSPTPFSLSSKTTHFSSPSNSLNPSNSPFRIRSPSRNQSKMSFDFPAPNSFLENLIREEKQREEFRKKEEGNEEEKVKKTREEMKEEQEESSVEQ